MSLNPITVVLSIIAMGLALRVGLRLMYGVRGARPGDPLLFFLSVLSWILLLAGGAAFFAASFFGALVPLLICAFAFLEVVLARRTQQRQDAWAIVTRAAAADRPVEPALRENLGRFHGPVGRSVQRFLKQLAQGTPLATAVDHHRRAFPPQAQAHAALAESGGLPISKTAGEETSSDGDIELWRLGRRFSYLVWVVLAMFAIVTFIMVMIVPAFKEIFTDFGLELPSITLALVDGASFPLANLVGMMVACFALLFVAGSLLTMLCYAFDIPVLKRVTDRIFYVWHRADVLRLLATVIENRMPLSDAVGRLAYGQPRYPNLTIAKRLRRCYERMDQGVDWRDAMRKSHLLEPADAELLRAAETAGNQPWALQSIADRHVARASFRWEAWQQIGFTAIILLFGLFVGRVCLALFLPLVKLIEGLT